MTWSTATNAFAGFLSLDVTVNPKWTHVLQTAVAMVPDAHPVKTIKIFIALALSDGLAACATKTLMNANSRHHHVATVQPVKTSMDPTSAFVLKAMKAKIVQSIRMIALLSHVRIVEHVWTRSVTTLACATKGSKESNARLISTSVCPNRAKTALRATSTSTLTHALVRSAFQE